MYTSFSFPRPTTKTDDLEDLYKMYGVDRAVVLDLATTETPETVQEGYCGAYLSFFHSCGLIFPVSEPILEILAELGLSLTQLLRSSQGILSPSWLGLGRKVFLLALVSSDSSF